MTNNCLIKKPLQINDVNNLQELCENTVVTRPIFGHMKKSLFQEQEQIPFFVYIVYAILIVPISLILLINKMISPLCPTVSFYELDEIAKG
jgi:hypothetical protein